MNPKWLVVVALLAVGCPSGREIGGRSASAPLAEFEVEFGGCDGSGAGPVCLVEQTKEIVLWLNSGPDAFFVKLDGRRVAPLRVEPTRNGHRLAIEVEPTSALLELRHEAGGEAFQLRIAPLERPGWSSEARQAVAEGKLDEAQEILDQAADLQVPQERSLALAMSGQLALYKGESGRAEALLEQALPGLEEQADRQAEADFVGVLAYCYLAVTNRFGAARGLLDKRRPEVGSSLERRYNQHYFEGLLGAQTGDLRSALEGLEAAVEVAERLGNRRNRHLSEDLLASQLTRLGRHDEAREVLASLVAEAEEQGWPCRTGKLLNNLGWSRLLTLEADLASDDPLPELERAAELIRTSCNGQARERVNVELNIALAALHADRPNLAHQALARARELDSQPGLRLVLWERELVARLALAEGQAGDAELIFSRLRTMADSIASPETAWRAAAGRARALQALGRPQEAVDAFRDAEQLLADELLAVPAHEGRESFVAYRGSATRRHLDLLLELGRYEQALALARASRNRVTQQLSRSVRQRILDPEHRLAWDEFQESYQAVRAEIESAAAQDWQWPADEVAELRRQRQEQLSELRDGFDRLLGEIGEGASATAVELQARPGELVVLFHRLARGWAVFLRDVDRLRVERLDCGSQENESSQELAACLLAGLDLTPYQSLRLLPPAELERVDFQTLAYRGAPLLAAIPLLYDLDLPRDRATADPLGNFRPSSAVILADPTGDLPAARLEAQHVRRVLEPGTTVRRLGEEAVGTATLRSALESSELFHFAGHADFAGRGGWDSFIQLSDGDSFSVEDILALDQAPRWVFLSGCETAGAEDQVVGVEGLGLAQAFLIAGSEWVVATDQAIEDRTAVQLVERYYDHWLAGEDLAAALQKAQLELREQGEGWGHYRLLRGGG